MAMEHIIDNQGLSKYIYHFQAIFYSLLMDLDFIQYSTVGVVAQPVTTNILQNVDLGKSCRC